MENSLGFCVDAVLPAGGTGQRMGLKTPKQFHKIYGRCLICYTLDVFESISWIRNVAVPVANDWKPFLMNLIKENNYTKIIIADGKSTRHRSIFEGVLSLKREHKAPDVVIIHDAVRPLVDEGTIKDIAVAARDYGASGAVRPLISTVVVKDEQDCMDHSLDRSRCRSSEMPQGFRYNIIFEAYRQTSENEFEYGTECLQLAKTYMGISAKLIDGPETLWKVTHQKDINTLERVLEDQMKIKVFIHKSSSKHDRLYLDIIEEIRLQKHEVVEVHQNGSDMEQKNEKMIIENKQLVTEQLQGCEKCFFLCFLDELDVNTCWITKLNGFHVRIEMSIIVYQGDAGIAQQANKFIHEDMHNETSIPSCGISYDAESTHNESLQISKKVLELINIIKKHGSTIFQGQLFTF